MAKCSEFNHRNTQAQTMFLLFYRIFMFCSGQEFHIGQLQCNSSDSCPKELARDRAAAHCASASFPKDKACFYVPRAPRNYILCLRTLELKFWRGGQTGLNWKNNLGI